MKITYDELEEKNTILHREWDTQKNNKDIYSMSEKVWWKCSKCGYSWDATISRRLGTQNQKGTGCPYCAGKVFIAGVNDLSTVSPWYLSEWDAKKNSELGITPDNLFCRSGKKVWWKCSKCGQDWMSTPSHRASGRGCPLCAKANRKSSWSKNRAQNNNFAEKHPSLLEEWDYESNNANEIFPDAISCYAQVNVWWKCSVCGHRWQAEVSRRSMGLSLCPHCNKRGTSFGEQAIFYYTRKVFPDAINRYQGFEKELDIYIPTIKTAIEYDGVAWHNGKNKLKQDNYKDDLCAKNGIKIIRFRDPILPKTNRATIIDCVDKRYLGLEDGIKELMQILPIDCTIDINISRDYSEINSELRNSLSQNNLSNLFPNIAKEWCIEENNGLLPSQVMPCTDRKFWWKCSKCGYKWRASANNRTRLKSGCPACSGHVVITGRNDFKTMCSREGKELLLEEWDYEKNNALGIFPDQISYKSHKRVWWKCNVCGKEWNAVVSSRSFGNVGCRDCGRQRSIKANRKAVINLDTGEIFKSIKAANEQYGRIRSTHISDACKGKCSAAFGYRWAFLPDE